MDTKPSIKKYLFLLFALLFLFSGCSKDEEKAEDPPAPDLPPVSSFAMDFSDFTDKDTTQYKSTETYQHFGRSFVHVTVWNVVLTITMVVPVAAFYESFQHEAVYDPGTSSWIWSYNFKAAGIIHKASLHASLSGDDVIWEMYISKDNAYTDFLWYSGTSKIGNTEGTWRLYNNPNDPAELLDIEWEEDPPSGYRSTKYTSIIAGDDNYGSYIEFGYIPTNPLNAFYNIYFTGADNMINIEWKDPDFYGRIKEPNYFGNEDWHCWDENLLDVICP
ncbi:MAG: hypothetical protein K8R53_13945 [Bacteroidales bacterium]|nr:hypothetical protein [Bacteroidales bacterium]